MGIDSTLTSPGATSFIAAARALLDRVEAQGDAISQVAGVCADAIAADGLVHLFGTGHSRIPVEEMFPRYGSYPGFNPIVELSMTFHTQVVGSNGQRQAMFIERMPGLAETILSNFEFLPTDVMIVFSASGLSAVPIEMATGARDRGLTVVAVTSVAQSLAGDPTHPAGRLLDNADIVLDLGTPVGDALVTIDGLDTPVGARFDDRRRRARQRDQGPDGRVARRAGCDAARAHEPGPRRQGGFRPTFRCRLFRARQALRPVAQGCSGGGRKEDRHVGLLTNEPPRSTFLQEKEEGQLKLSSKSARWAVALVTLVAVAVTVAVAASARTEKSQAKFVLGVSNTLVGNGWREEMICAVKAQAAASGVGQQGDHREPQRRAGGADRRHPQPDLGGCERDHHQPVERQCAQRA